MYSENAVKAFLFYFVVLLSGFILAEVKGYPAKLKFQIGSNTEENAIQMTVRANGKVLLSGSLGLAMPNAVGMVSLCPQTDYSECYRYKDYGRLEINDTKDGCSHLIWTSNYAKKLEDCFDLIQGHHWYGGGETHVQHWPIENDTRAEEPFITGDSLSGSPYGSVIEPYWLVSSGVSIKVDDDVPLFMSWGKGEETKRVCFAAKPESPYQPRDILHMSYHICLGNNVKEVHEAQIQSGVIPRPSAIPDTGMLTLPFWSTWVQYKEDVDQPKVIDYATRIIAEGFTENSHIEIDDDWETCYGELQFNPTKFPDPKGMVETLKSLGFRTTLWVHPFINLDCAIFGEAMTHGYLVKGTKGRTGITKWWQGDNAGIVDFTNPKAVKWWISRLEALKNYTGIDSYKFDAGEASYLPVSPDFGTKHPNQYSTAYVDAVATFGGLVEVRSGFRTQTLPIFTRILDRTSTWGHDNGLRSILPTNFQFAITGYPFVLPDMIGGNYFNGEPPSEELYIRWMQLNTFMPAFQFSLAPWNYDTQVIEIAKGILSLRKTFSDLLIRAAEQSVDDGSPINRPLWWADPTDPEALTIDSEYLVGDALLVAPVLEEGAVSRDIYLPNGTWTAHTGQTYEGPAWIRDFPAPLDTLPFFLRGTLELHELTNEMPQD